MGVDWRRTEETLNHQARAQRSRIQASSLDRGSGGDSSLPRLNTFPRIPFFKGEGKRAVIDGYVEHRGKGPPRKPNRKPRNVDDTFGRIFRWTASLNRFLDGQAGRCFCRWKFPAFGSQREEASSLFDNVYRKRPNKSLVGSWHRPLFKLVADSPVTSVGLLSTFPFGHRVQLCRPEP